MLLDFISIVVDVLILLFSEKFCSNCLVRIISGLSRLVVVYVGVIVRYSVLMIISLIVSVIVVLCLWWFV